METPTPRHRHFVAFPMLALAIALGFADANLHFPSMLSAVSERLQVENDERFTLDNGVFGIVYAGGDVEQGDVINLHNGSVLLSSSGLIQLHVDDYSMMSFDGSIHITKGTSAVSVAAITAPVYITRGDQRVVVPVGMQWEGKDSLATLADGFSAWMSDRAVRPLPSTFVERVLSDLSIVRKPDSTLPQLQYLLPLDVLPNEDILLPVSESNKKQQEYEHILGYVRHVAEKDDTQRFEEIQTLPNVSDALQSERGVAVLAALLSSMPEQQTAMRMLLLQQLISDEGVWMISSFHPRYRDIAWGVFEPDVSVESHLSRVFLFPYSFFSAGDFSDFVLERYSVALHGIIDTVKQKESFVEHLSEAHMPLVERLEGKGYPLRAEFLANTLDSVIREFDAPTAYLQDVLVQLAERGRISLDPLPPKREPEPEPEHHAAEVAPEPEPVQEKEAIAPNQVEAMAYAMLERAGALFTVHTSVSADEPNSARVTDVLFSSPKKDRSVSFTLNVATGTVSHIEIDGNTDFPYEPTFEGFVTWIRK